MSIIGSAVLLLLGAIIGFVPNLLLERTKQRHAVRTRWDVPLFELCKQFTASARQVVHLARRLDRAPDRPSQVEKLDEKHAELRGLSEQVRLLGSSELQEAARLVIHHCYAVRATAEGQPDARAKDYADPPEKRMKDAIRAFLIASRRQLGVGNPQDVNADEVLADEPWKTS
ncbi:MAG: hypothetical protein QOI21_5779 [Actinomycetota bacterium]|jgi:hypothetical protein|nr:hypothetical protein [Actinomycetota bacterium]